MILVIIFVTAILILFSVAFGYYLGSIRNRQNQPE
jgi:hypothetical protein